MQAWHCKFIRLYAQNINENEKSKISRNNIFSLVLIKIFIADIIPASANPINITAIKSPLFMWWFADFCP